MFSLKKNNKKMKYAITESQYNYLKEYIDPIHYLKKKFTNEPEGIRDPKYIKYEDRFQKFVDYLYKLTVKSQGGLKHLKGFKVLKVTPTTERNISNRKWVILISPVVDDWFNWRDNPVYKEELLNFYRSKFNYVFRHTGFDESPIPVEGYEDNIKPSFAISL